MTSVGTDGSPIEMPVFLCDTSSIENFVSKRALRRVDHFSRMAVLGAYLALEDAGISPGSYENLAVVIATGYGATRTTFSFLDSIIHDGDACASPTMFSNSVHNAAAAHISILLNATGLNLTVSQFELSVPSAILTACQWLEYGLADAVLFGGVDEYCNVLGYSWQRFFGSSNESNMAPLNWDVQSAIAGEGSAFFLLTREEGDKSLYGSITGIRLGNGLKNGLDFAKDAILFLGADGHKSYGRQYDRNIRADRQAAVYTPLYGSFPVGNAFDMVIAALSLKAGRVFATPKYAGNRSGLRVVWEAQALDTNRICCLKFSCAGEFGAVMLSAV